MNENTKRIVSTTILTVQAKNYPIFSILLSKKEILHAWNKLNLYKLAASSTQNFSMINSNEQLLNDSQCNG